MATPEKEALRTTGLGSERRGYAIARPGKFGDDTMVVDGLNKWTLPREAGSMHLVQS